MLAAIRKQVPVQGLIQTCACGDYTNMVQSESVSHLRLGKSHKQVQCEVCFKQELVVKEQVGFPFRVL